MKMVTKTFVGLSLCFSVAACSSETDDDPPSDGGAEAAGGDNPGPDTALGGSTLETGGGDANTGGDAPGAGGSATGAGGTDPSGGGGSPTVTPQPFKGVANSPCDVRRAVGASWFYNWGRNIGNVCDDGAGGEFVPMIFGNKNATAIADGVAALSAAGHPRILTFNEPDGANQADIDVGTALDVWPGFASATTLISSPATSGNANGRAWMQQFMAGADAEGLQIDFVALHWYGWNEGSCNATASQFENHINAIEAMTGERPIWITEFGCLHQSNPDFETVAAFFRGALEVFARHPRIERYAWYPHIPNNGLVDGAGELTPVGVAFAEAPAFK